MHLVIHRKMGMQLVHARPTAAGVARRRRNAAAHAGLAVQVAMSEEASRATVAIGVCLGVATATESRHHGALSRVLARAP